MQPTTRQDLTLDSRSRNLPVLTPYNGVTPHTSEDPYQAGFTTGISQSPNPYFSQGRQPKNEYKQEPFLFFDLEPKKNSLYTYWPNIEIIPYSSEPIIKIAYRRISPFTHKSGRFIVHSGAMPVWQEDWNGTDLDPTLQKFYARIQVDEAHFVEVTSIYKDPISSSHIQYVRTYLVAKTPDPFTSLRDNYHEQLISLLVNSMQDPKLLELMLRFTVIPTMRTYKDHSNQWTAIAEEIQRHLEEDKDHTLKLKLSYLIQKLQKDPYAERKPERILRNHLEPINSAETSPENKDYENTMQIEWPTTLPNHQMNNLKGFPFETTDLHTLYKEKKSLIRQFDDQDKFIQPHLRRTFHMDSPVRIIPPRNQEPFTYYGELTPKEDIYREPEETKSQWPITPSQQPLEFLQTRAFGWSPNQNSDEV